MKNIKRSGPEKADLLTLEELDRAHIIKVLEKTNWKISGKDGAAKILGRKRTTLLAKMKKLKIIRPS